MHIVRPSCKGDSMKRHFAGMIALLIALSMLLTACDPAAVAGLAEAAKNYGIAMKEAKQEAAAGQGAAEAAAEAAAEEKTEAAAEEEAEEVTETAVDTEAPAESESTEAVPAGTETGEEAETAEAGAEEILTDEERFEKFLDDYVLDYVTEDYTSLHWAYMDPEAAGIDRSTVEVTLGHILEDEEETLAEIAQLREDLAGFDYDSLNKAEQALYDRLLFEADLQEKMLDDKYKYLDSVWSSNSGIHQILISYFSEFFIYNEQDAADMITLVRDIPRYVDEALDYSVEQADAGLLTLDVDLVVEDIDEVLASRDDSAIVRSYQESVGELDIDEEAKEAYVNELKEAMDTCFYPSYEKMKETLTKLNEEGRVLPLTAIGALPNGREYYELLMQDANGSSNTVGEVRDILLDQAMQAYLDMQKTIMEDEKLAELDLDGLMTDFEDIASIIYYDMERYTKEFPAVKEMNFDLSGINDERAGDFSAYFVVPPIDNTNKYQIRYNEREIGTEAGTLSMFQTISHEGVPGHMYQAQFNNENLVYPAQFIYKNSAFSEGWATYASIVAMRELEVPEQKLVQLYNSYMNFLQIYVTVMEMDLNYEGYDVDKLTEVYGDMFEAEWLKDLYTLLADNRIYYMPYFYGTSMLLSLRSYAESELGDAFDPVEFHRVLLQDGATIFDVVIRNVEEYVQENKE